jgi:hypothetical protein
MNPQSFFLFFFPHHFSNDFSNDEYKSIRLSQKLNRNNEKSLRIRFTLKQYPIIVNYSQIPELFFNLFREKLWRR